MTSVILLAIVVLWMAVLLPPLVRSRPPSRTVRLRSVPTGHQVAGPPAGLGPVAPLVDGPSARMARMPRSSAEAARRRQQVVVALVVMALLTLVAVPLIGVVALPVHLLFDGAVAGYLWLAHQRQDRAADRLAVVRPLPRRTVAPAVREDAVLRRAAGGSG